MKKIAIIGSTGMLGKPVTKEFIKAGYDVTLLVRDIEKAKKVFGTNVTFVQGDVQDLKAIEAVIKDQDALYLNLSIEQDPKAFQPEGQGLDNILSVAKKSSLKRIGYLSSLVHLYQGQNGFNWWVFDIRQKAVANIKNSGLTYSIFYPSTFMESFVKGPYKQGNRLTIAGPSKQKMYLVSGSDYGKQVIKAFELDNGNQEYVIQGQEGFTAYEAAKAFADNYEKEKIKITRMPLGLVKIFSLFSHQMNYGYHIQIALNNYPEKFDAEKTWQDLGKPQTTYVDYIRQN